MSKPINANIISGGILQPFARYGKKIYYKVFANKPNKTDSVYIGNDLAVDNNEIIEQNGNTVRVASADLGTANLIERLAGNLPVGKAFNKAYNAQERYKDIHKLNDDGTRKARTGKKIIYNNEENIDTRVKSAADFVENYYNSEGYKKRVELANKHLNANLPLESPLISTEIEVKDYENANNSNNYTLSNTNDRFITIGTANSGSYGIPFTTAHELGHSVSYNQNNKSGLPDYHKMLLLNRNTNNTNNHDENVNENYSDLIGSRVVLKNLGIWDASSGEEFTNEMYDKYNQMSRQNARDRFFQTHDKNTFIQSQNLIAQRINKDNNLPQNTVRVAKGGKTKLNDDSTRKAKTGTELNLNNTEETNTSYNLPNQPPLIYNKELGSAYVKPPLKDNKLDLSGLKTTNGRYYNNKYIQYIWDCLQNYDYTDNQRASLLANIIEESGGDPFAIDSTKKFKGLLQWAEDRYTPDSNNDIYTEIDNQLKYIYDTSTNLTDKVSWTHGGIGSGYNSLTDANNAWSKGETLQDVMRGYTLGYVRPTGKVESYNNRVKVAEQLLDRINAYNESMNNMNKTPIESSPSTGKLFKRKVNRKVDGGEIDEAVITEQLPDWLRLSKNELGDINSLVDNLQNQIIANINPIPRASNKIPTVKVTPNLPSGLIQSNTFKNNRNRFYQNNNTANTYKVNNAQRLNDIKNFIISPKGLFTGAAIVDTIGNVVTGIGDINTAKNLQGPVRPLPLEAIRGKFDYNVDPFIDANNNALASTVRTVNNNTASSLNRRNFIQSANNEWLANRNRILAEKQNIETDRLNQWLQNKQNIRNQNIAQFSNYLNATNEFENNRKLQIQQARNNIIQGIGNTLGSLATNIANVDFINKMYPQGTTPLNIRCGGKTKMKRRK